MSLLTIVQNAMGEIGLTPPPAVVGSGDVRVTQAQALVNRAAKEIMKEPGAADCWPVISKPFLFNMNGAGPFTGTLTPGSKVITGMTGTGLANVAQNWVASSQYLLNDTLVVSVDTVGNTVTLNQNPNLTATQGAQTDTAIAFGQEAYAYPADLGHFTPQTQWDRNFRWQLLGPVSAQEWQVLKSGISPVGPRIRFRLMQGMIYLNPAPYIPTGQSGPNTDLIVMEYSSIYWAAPANVTGQPTQSSMQADTDTSLAFPEDLLTLSLKWRMLKAIGMAYDDEYDEYNDAKNVIAGRQTVARNLPLNARSTGIRLLNSQQVPDTGFGT